jgi:hypothetical protein
VQNTNYRLVDGEAFTQRCAHRDWQRYEKMLDPWPAVSKNLAAV